MTGHLHLHHGLANALILPYAMRFNLPVISPDRVQRLNRLAGLPAEAGGEQLVEALAQFVTNLGLPTHLSELNLPLDAVNWPAIAEETTRMVLLQNNPRPATVADCEALLAEMRG
ncbi:MAG: iron-containing alcohol dehydrogenase [Anaerolineales bacterium]|nr:iron-containing alcohol dehydrogenase [Anaerolineales bacterium]